MTSFCLQERFCELRHHIVGQVHCSSNAVNVTMLARCCVWNSCRQATQFVKYLNVGIFPISAFYFIVESI